MASKNVGEGPVIVYRVTHIASGRSYIGITTRTRAKRWAGHIADASGASGRQNALQHAIKKYGAAAFSVETLYEAIDIREAAMVERGLIAAYGTMRPRGFNLTSGGEMRAGYRMSPEAVERNRQARLGKTLTQAHRDAIGAGVAAHRKTNPVSEDTRRKIGAAHQGRPLSADHIENVRRGTREAMARPEVRAKVDAAMASEDVRAKISAGKRATWADPEFRKKTAGQRARFGEIGASLWNDPATRPKMEAAARDPGRRAKIVAAAKARWADPKFKERMKDHLVKMTEAARLKNTSEKDK